jgi:putative transposase
MRRIAYSDEVNFITMTVVDWIDVFTRVEYKETVIKSLEFCRKNKKMSIFAYVLMTNHLHLVVQTDGTNLSDIVRDFKGFTAKEIIKQIELNSQESRKEWLLKTFRVRGHYNPANEVFQFWQNGFYPVALTSFEMIEQKIDYIHWNPVTAGFVNEPYEWLYSSANALSPLKVDEL